MSARTQRFGTILRYLRQVALEIHGRPLTRDERYSAWKQSEKYTIDDLLLKADLDRKERRENGE